MTSVLLAIAFIFLALLGGRALVEATFARDRRGRALAVAEVAICIMAFAAMLELR